jgi:hypothetical protein
MNCTAPQIDRDTMMTVMKLAIDAASVIRRDHRWTRSDDGPRRHEFGLRDLEKNFLPRCDTITRAVCQALINAERDAFRSMIAAKL